MTVISEKDIYRIDKESLFILSEDTLINNINDKIVTGFTILKNEKQFNIIITQ
jgi:hypothetical protein